MDHYAATKSSATLFVHFDKNVYSNYENVWLRAYLLNSSVSADSINTLSVFLVKNNDRSIWAESRFVMQNGLASGHLFLPDTLPPGNFSFVAYTNHVVNGNPDAVFIQPITIKTIDADVALSLRLLDSTHAKDTVTVLLKATTNDFKPLAKASFTYTYTLGSDGSPQRASTNKQGEYLFHLPMRKSSSNNGVLHVEMKNGMLFKQATLALPFPDKPARVKFYPEGGNIVDATPVVVGWEAKTEKEPLSVRGMLYENGRVIDTIATDANGMGRFTLVARKQNTYTLKLLYAPSKDTVYRLPATLPNMPTLSVSNALAEDTLNVQLQNINTAAGKLYLVLHNYRTLFSAYQVSKSASNQLVQVSLQNLPRGLFTITLLDDSGRPFAERLCFAHYDQESTVAISSDSTQYGTRQKVTLQIKLSGSDRKPIDGIVSVACVQANRIEATKMQDIESYTYFTEPLANMPLLHKPFALPANSNQKLQNALLIKGWRRYTWTDMLRAKTGDTSVRVDKMIFEAQVTHNKKALTKPVEVSLYSDSSLQILTTDKSGRFELSYPNLVAPPDTKFLLFVNKASQAAYTIQVKNPYHELNEKLAKELSFEKNDIAQRAKDVNSFVLEKGDYAPMLATVTVKANTTAGKFYGHFPNGKCTDYVCLFGVLNCPNHRHDPDNRKPIKGHWYISGETGNRVIYISNCEETPTNFLQTVDGIYTAKEFYVTDFSNATTEFPEYLSTIYWNPALLLTDGKLTTISFYTSDITGPFRVIVQGRTSKDVVYGEYFFNVKSN